MHRGGHRAGLDPAGAWAGDRSRPGPTPDREPRAGRGRAEHAGRGDQDSGPIGHLAQTGPRRRALAVRHRLARRRQPPLRLSARGASVEARCERPPPRVRPRVGGAARRADPRPGEEDHPPLIGLLQDSAQYALARCRRRRAFLYRGGGGQMGGRLGRRRPHLDGGEADRGEFLLSAARLEPGSRSSPSILKPTAE